MKYKDEISGIAEPMLVAIFQDLNYRFFNDSLPLPDSLAFDYRNRKSGGSMLTTKDGGHCYYIVVRGKQKTNTKFVEETMLHEMLHWKLALQFYNSELPELGYALIDFVNDKSATFILEGAKLAREYGCTFKAFLRWSSKDNPDKNTTMTQKTYHEVQDAKSLLATLFEGD